MKKIIVSLLAVVTVIGAVAVGTRAYFSDTETSVDNTFTAGTIDISVDGENPWTSSYTESMGDFKPGGHEREYSYTIKNVGNNPVNIWKRVVITDQNTGVETEPECDDQNGVWANPDGLCDWAGTADNNVMAPYMHYAMDVAGSPLIDMDWDVRMSEMDAVWTPLQSLEPGDSVVIRQVYTLDETAGNEFQGDEIVFDIELYGEQLMAPGPTSDAKAVVLENKSGDPHWTPVMDNIWGLLTWDDSGNYRVRAWNLAGTQYQMQAWDAVNDSSYGMFGSTYGGGDVDDTDLYTGLNTNTDAKYWLRDTDTYSPTLTLWEATLVN